jgi:hypothetical protein
MINALIPLIFRATREKRKLAEMPHDVVKLFCYKNNFISALYRSTAQGRNGSEGSMDWHLPKMVAAHKFLAADRTGEVLFSCVGSSVAGQFI